MLSSHVFEKLVLWLFHPVNPHKDAGARIVGTGTAA
jgi:hypothetical protein